MSTSTGPDSFDGFERIATAHLSYAVLASCSRTTALHKEGRESSSVADSRACRFLSDNADLRLKGA